VLLSRYTASSDIDRRPNAGGFKMSNLTVGNVYQQIIRDVIETSRVDFEEGGVDEGVLDELTRVSF
jgi:hypothetical protein